MRCSKRNREWGGFCILKYLVLRKTPFSHKYLDGNYEIQIVFSISFRSGPISNK